MSPLRAFPVPPATDSFRHVAPMDFREQGRAGQSSGDSISEQRVGFTTKPQTMKLRAARVGGRSWVASPVSLPTICLTDWTCLVLGDAQWIDGPGRTAATGCAIGATGSTANEPSIRGDRNTHLGTLRVAPIFHAIKRAEIFAFGQIVAYIRAGRIFIIQFSSNGRVSLTS